MLAGKNPLLIALALGLLAGLTAWTAMRGRERKAAERWATVNVLCAKVDVAEGTELDQEMIAVSVDGGTETVVDDYSPTRNASGVVWTSPVLASGAHTLRIRVTGNRNPAGSGYNVAVDSVDVTG